MSILLTGFEPFNGANTNPSWDALSFLPDSIAGHPVHLLQLPVEYHRAASLLRDAIAQIRPEIVICCGVAAGRQALTPELVAINYHCASIPDNAGLHLTGQPIRPDGPAAYMTSLPIHEMINAVREAGLPCALSLSAGAYVCNDVYYALLDCEAAYGHRGLFVHVPKPDVISAEDMAKAIALCAGIALTSPVQPADEMHHS